MNKSTLGIYLNPLVGFGKLEIDFSKGFDDLYKWLECRLVGITYRYIGGKEYIILCDDEGLLKEDNNPSAIALDNVALVGNLFILKNVDSDNLGDCGLSEDDIEHIYKHMVIAGIHNRFSNKTESYHCILLGE